MSRRSIASLARCRYKGERWSPCCRMRRQTSDGFLAVSRRMHRVVQTSGKCTEVVGLVLVGPLRLPQAPLSTDIELCTRNDAWSRGVGTSRAGCGVHPKRVAAYKFQAPKFMSVSQPMILAPDWGHMSTVRQDLFTMDRRATGLARWEDRERRHVPATIEQIASSVAGFMHL